MNVIIKITSLFNTKTLVLEGGEGASDGGDDNPEKVNKLKVTILRLFKVVDVLECFHYIIYIYNLKL